MWIYSIAAPSLVIAGSGERDAAIGGGVDEDGKVAAGGLLGECPRLRIPPGPEEDAYAGTNDGFSRKINESCHQVMSA